MFFSKKNPCVYYPGKWYPTRNQKKKLRKTCAWKGETFFSKFSSTCHPKHLKDFDWHPRLAKSKERGDIFFKIFKYIPSEAFKKAPVNTADELNARGEMFFLCPNQNISKDAHTEASRRMLTSKHLEGCALKSFVKNKQRIVAHNKEHR